MKPKIKISYWTYPGGEDFVSLDKFKKELDSEVELEIASQETDALGGGLYEFILEVYSKFHLADFVKDYTEDIIKGSVGVAGGFLGKHVIKSIKKLFSKNKKLTPGFELIKLIYRDVTVFLYPLYPDSLIDVTNDIIKVLAEHYSKIVKAVDSPVTEIHIPIFNKIDSYGICDYRVRLNVDENIENFSKEDYFKIWGIKCVSKHNFVYKLEENKADKIKFYTQEEYDTLFDEWYRRNNPL
jgi:hypothetical protein